MLLKFLNKDRNQTEVFYHHGTSPTSVWWSILLFIRKQKMKWKFTFKNWLLCVCSVKNSWTIHISDAYIYFHLKQNNVKLSTCYLKIKIYLRMILRLTEIYNASSLLWTSYNSILCCWHVIPNSDIDYCNTLKSCAVVHINICTLSAFRLTPVIGEEFNKIYRCRWIGWQLFKIGLCLCNYNSY